MAHPLIKKIAEHLVVVEQVTDPEIINFRLSRCNTCSSLKGDSCALCGCFVDLKARSLTNRTALLDIEVTHCPLGRWGDKKIAEQYKQHKI